MWRQVFGATFFWGGALVNFTEQISARFVAFQTANHQRPTSEEVIAIVDAVLPASLSWGDYLHFSRNAWMMAFNEVGDKLLTVESLRLD